jgi:hypothetical protein
MCRLWDRIIIDKIKEVDRLEYIIRIECKRSEYDEGCNNIYII